VTFDEAVEALSRALRFGIHPSLAGIRALTGALGRPQDAYRSVQVTGTNGKSSVTRMTAAMLQAHGMRSGAYTSPHLESYAERIEVAGAPVSEADFARAVETALSASEELAAHAAETLGLDDAPVALTEFELLTGAALWLFRELGVEWACLEVGMGGRWDATSVVAPAVAVVTGVALDHVERLGHTVDEIAADKAHVVKPGSVAVLGPATAHVDAILTARAAEVGAPLVRVRESGADVVFCVTGAPSAPGGATTLDVDGRFGRYPDLAPHAPRYQAANAAVAVAAAEAAVGAPLDADAVRGALARIRFPGRFEVVRERPALVLDGAHNPQAASVLASAIDDAFPTARPVVVLGVLSDKDAEGIIGALAPVADRFVVTRPASARALPAAELAAEVRRVTGVAPVVEPDVRRALETARELAGERGVVVTGSLYTVGEARALLRRRPSS
jgi:dihydrofolate synthase/folylpolyglutamate synthase